jgi:hypothetical protein
MPHGKIRLENATFPGQTQADGDNFAPPRANSVFRAKGGELCAAPDRFRSQNFRAQAAEDRAKFGEFVFIVVRLGRGNRSLTCDAAMVSDMGSPKSKIPVVWDAKANGRRGCR